MLYACCVKCDVLSACLISVQQGEQVFYLKGCIPKCHFLGGEKDLKKFKYHLKCTDFKVSNAKTDCSANYFCVFVNGRI